MSNKTGKTCPRCGCALLYLGNSLLSGNIWWCRNDGVSICSYHQEFVKDTVIIPKALTEAFGKIQEDKDKLMAKQAEALDEIAEILSGKEWNSDTPTYIAEVILRTGRNIQDMEEA